MAEITKQIKKNFKEVMLLIISIAILSYLLNFLWESVHAVFLYNDHNILANKYVAMGGYVSMIDMLIILGVYILVSLLWKDLFWIRLKDAKPFVVFIIFNLIAAAFIEYRAVFLIERWSYNSFMPTILGIGLSPLIQLSITGIIAVLTVKRMQ